jgi:molybdopterin converting factor small subunit
MSQELELQIDETGKVTVRVLFFGAARDAVGESEMLVSFRKHTTAASAFKHLRDTYPALNRFGRSLLFAINEEYARPEREVFEGDELAVFPSVSGGVA